MKKPHQEDFILYRTAISSVNNGSLDEGYQILVKLHQTYKTWDDPFFVLCELSLSRKVICSETDIQALVDKLKSKNYEQNALAFYLRSINSEHLGDYGKAKILLKNCLRLNQNFHAATQKLAFIHMKLEEWEDATLLLKRQVTIYPNQAHLLANLSVVLMRQNHLEDALEIGLKSEKLASEGELASIYLNLGTIYQELGKLKIAFSYYTKTLDINPNNSNVHLNLGVLALQEKNFNDAEIYFLKALDIDSENIKASVNLAGLYLLKGQEKKGWDLYEKRLHKNTKIMEYPLQLPMWEGQKLNGSLILVHEQGLGDSFQFIRYSKALMQKGINTYFKGPKKLHNIFQYSGLADRFIDEHAEIPADAEAWIGLMSLPRLSLENTNTDSIDNSSYLNVSQEKVQSWKSLLGNTNKKRIALHWQGNPDHEFTISRGRSVPLDQLIPFLKDESIEWISLQKGPGSEGTLDKKYAIYWHKAQNIIEDIWDFEETAAILKCCDGLISSDSGLAHLAGGLGIPVALMLPWLAEWRWGTEKNITRWYKYHHLYRQHKKGDWSAVVNDIKNDLKNNLIFC